LTAFKYRFNSFNREKPHDFLTAMTKLLGDAYTRSRRPGVVNKLMYREEAEYRSNIALLHRTCDEIVAARRKSPDPEAGDLLNRMINDKDPETGAKLPDDNIRYQMVTFLIAGHETTSGTLAFTVYYLLKNPAIMRKAREEADAAVKDAGGHLAAINPTKLPYLDAVLKEALRLQTTATFWTRAPKEDVELPGGYFLKKGQPIGVVPHCLHRDPKAWGADAEEFRPERWLEGTVFPPDSWKPFGNGARACIGQLFAMQEGLLALAVVLHRFELDFADKGYDLKIKMGITIQPDGFRIVAKPRQGRNQSLIGELFAAGGTAASAAPTVAKPTLVNGTSAPAVEAKDKLVFLYGSNSATCETLASELAAEGAQRGYGTKAAALDTVAKDGKLPTEGRVVICTPSYEGLPPGNGRQFVEAITKEQDKTTLKGVRYAVFGAGHHDWPRTFHKVPKLIDTRLEELGAQRFMPLSLADAGGDIVDDIETFKSKLWEALGGSSGSADGASSQPLSVQVVPSSVNPTAALLSAGVEELGTVVSQTTLVEAEADRRKKVHTTIRLAKGCPYRAGDYLAVLPKNPPATVSRALARLGLEPDSVLTLQSGTSSPHLPRGTPVRAGDLLESYVELGQQVSKRTLTELASQCAGDAAKVAQALADESNDEIVTKRLSLLDVLEKIPEHKPDLAFFLDSLHKMKIRQYSYVSSSRRLGPQHR
jgi:cytochrome P450/NADPH-cytochrome P450 reductase